LQFMTCMSHKLRRAVTIIELTLPDHPETQTYFKKADLGYSSVSLFTTKINQPNDPGDGHVSNSQFLRQNRLK